MYKNSNFRNQVINDANIIIIFEGIHMFKDPDTGEESNLSLWLPRFKYQLML